MRTHEEQKLFEAEKKIIDFNEKLRANPQLLNDELYLFNHMSQVRLKLKEIPQLNNLLLITQYFKSEREPSNYKLIHKDILNNPLFIASSIVNNPELYFYISRENKKIFKEHSIAYDKDYLKYLSDEDYDNPQRLKQISENFKQFDKSLTCITLENFKKLMAGVYASKMEEAIVKLDKKQCAYLQENIQYFVEERMKKSYSRYFSNLIEENPYIYTVLDKDKYMDKKKDIVSALKSYHNLFNDLPEEWRKDKDVLKEFLTADAKGYRAYYSHPSVIKPHIIVNKLEQDDLFGKNYIAETIEAVVKVYPDLNLTWRSNELLIDKLFKARDDFKITTTYCRGIPDKELCESLVAFIKKAPNTERKNIGDSLERLMLHYKIDKSLDKKDTSIKKVKI